MRNRAESSMERFHRQTVQYAEFAMNKLCTNDEARKGWEKIRDRHKADLAAVREKQGYTGVPC